MSSVNGYYNNLPRSDQRASWSLEGLPSVPASAPQAVHAFSPDTWSGYMSVAPHMAIEAAPYLHGAMVGHEGMASVRASARRRGGRVRAAGRGVSASEGLVGGALKGVLGAAKSSAVIGGAVSVGIHGYKVMQGQESVAEGGANVVGDLVAAAGGGAIGAAASAIGTAAFGLSGIPLALVGLGLGMAGYILGEAYMRRTPLFQKVTQSTFAALSPSSAPTGD